VKVNRSRIAGLRVLIIACVLAGLVVVILDAAGVKDWRAKAGAALAAAVVTVLGNVMQTSLNSMLNKRAELTEERAKRIFMPRGRLPRVKEIADPISIGVRPASPRPLAERQPAQHQPTQHQPDGRGDRVPVYVHRDVDPPLRQALAGRGFVLLVGDATAGKTRTAFEAMKAMLPEHVFISPSVLEDVASAVSAAAAARRCVLWLDNLPLFLGPDGLTRKSIAELMDGTDHHRVILATMRATDESRLIVAGAESGEQVMRISQGVIDQADHRFFVERLLSPSELARARERAGEDSRLAGAISHPRSSGIGEYLASGPQLYTEWQGARSRGHHPRAAALIAAAVDCRRAGYAGPLPRLLLVELHSVYLERYGGSQVYPEKLAQAWGWAVRPRDSGSAPLRYIDGAHCDVFDYFIDELQRRDGRLVPESIVQVALSYAGPADASAIANTAWRQGRYELAETAIRVVYDAVRQTSGPDDLDVLAIRNNLAVVLQDQGKTAEAEAEYRAILAARGGLPGADRPEVQAAARNNLAAILHDQGRLTEAEAEYRAIVEARRQARGPEHPETLAARNNLAGILQAQGRLTAAEAEYRLVRKARIDTLGPDHPNTLITRNNYAAVLGALGRLDEAEEEFREVLNARIRILGPDHPHTKKSRDNLASLRRRRSTG
jgi:eukaryotic-like serine/threonine-protein kinase